MSRASIAGACSVGASRCSAQSSASFKLDPPGVKRGGRPWRGAGRPRRAIDYARSIGDTVGSELPGPFLSRRYRVRRPLPSSRRDPDDAIRVPQPHHWTPERSVGAYNLYRNTLSSLPGIWEPATNRRSLRRRSTKRPCPRRHRMVLPRDRREPDSEKGRRARSAASSGRTQSRARRRSARAPASAIRRPRQIGEELAVAKVQYLPFGLIVTVV